MTTPHTIFCAQGPETVHASSPTPGLYVYEIPANVAVSSPLRWRLGHRSGLAIAAATSEADATRGAQAVADLADWTADYVDLRNKVDRKALFRRLSAAKCHHPDEERQSA